MLGVSESYLGAFAVELGHDNGALAILATVPPLCGALAQLCAPWLSMSLGSRKRLVVLGALLQALTHLGFMQIAAAANTSFATLLAVKVAFWTSGMVIGPPWNAWMASLTEGIPRASYFLWRTILCHLALLVSFLWSGSFLQQGRASDVYGAFALLFGMGLGARGLASMFLLLQIDPEPPVLRSVSLRGRLREAVKLGPWKLAIAIGLLQFGAHVSVPFFTPYMLRDLELELDTFAVLTAISIVGKAVSLPLWGALAKRSGLSALMTISVTGIATVPAIWVWATSFADLVLVQMVGGIVWAGFEYASFQLLLGTAPKASSIEFFSISSTLTGVLQLGGSMLGTALLQNGSDFHSVFLLSSLLRFLPLFLLIPVTLRLGRGIALRRFFPRLISVRPGGGVVRRPIFAASEETSPRTTSSQHPRSQ